MTDSGDAAERDTTSEHDSDEAAFGADGLLPDDQLALEILATDVEDEMSTSFMSYALSVIGSRAIPDVRDGLKPVQRRILYTAHESRLDPKGPYSKSAKVVGATMGTYHPHGDCLSGDTRIVALDGSRPTLAELVDTESGPLEVLAWSTEEQRPVAALAHSFRIGQHSSTVYRITLADGSSLEATGNHPFLTLDGEWVRAEDLRAGTALCAGEIYENSIGRPSIRAAGRSGTLVDFVTTPTPGRVWHHRNEDPWDNRSANLVPLTRDEHAAHHGDYLEGLESGRAAMFGDGGAYRDATRKKNSELMRAANAVQGVRKACQVRELVAAAGVPLTEDSYEQHRALVYNAPFLTTLVERGHITGIDDLAVLKAIVDTTGAVGHTAPGPSTPVAAPRRHHRPTALAKAAAVVAEALRSGAKLTPETYEESRQRLIAQHGLGNGNINGRSWPRLSRVAAGIDQLTASIAPRYLNWVTRVDVVELAEPAPFYDFTVDGHENLFVATGEQGGDTGVVCVHNSSIYATLVRMAQPFSLRVPLMDGQGNFGSLDDGPAAARYCVVGDTRVQLPDGTTCRIDELAGPVEANTDTPIDMKVLDWRGDTVRAEMLFHSGTHPTRRVRLGTGLELRGTGNHPVLTLAAPAGVPMFQWRLLDELSPGEYVAVTRDAAPGNPATSHELSVATLAGMLVAEGWASARRCGFNNTDREYFDAAVSAWDAVVGARAYIYTRTLPSGKTIWEFDCQVPGALEDGPLAPLIGQAAAAKRVPEAVRSMTPAGKARFLACLFEGDGSVRTSPRGAAQVTYSTYSSGLAQDVLQMLLEVGVIGRINGPSPRGEIKVTISNADELRRFAGTIGFPFAKRHALGELLAHLPDPPRGRGADTIPFVAEYLRTEAGRGSRKWLGKHDLCSTRVWRRDPEALLAKVNNTEAVDVVRPIVTSGFLFTPVVSNEDAGAAPVYSLRVATDDHSFRAGGVVNHNTECRMADAAIDMVEELAEDTVEFAPNYDGTTTEPVVLPSRIPNLLVNGTTGIAVGMATNIAPHHPAEVARAARALLADPDLDVDALMAYIPGPDFPCGGIIVDAGGIGEAYRSGRGAFKVRAKVEITRVSARRDGLVITELPPGVGPEAFIAKVKELVTAGTIDSISDIADYSDRRNGLRVTVEVKAGRDPRQVLAELYQRTPLEESFSSNHVVLDGFTPRTLGLKGILARWLEHRGDVVERRTQYRLNKAERRAHLVEGLVKAMDALDEVIATIRSSKETAIARTKLRKLLSIDDVQADHILEMQLRRLTRLEVNKLRDELKELRALIADLRDILARPERRAAIIDGELGDVEARYDTPRRSAIVDAAALDDPAPAARGAKGAPAPASTVPDEPCLITIGRDGTLARRPVESSGRVTGADLVAVCVEATTASPARFVTDTGRLLRCDTFEIPPVDDKGRGGCAASELVDVEGGERIVGVLSPTAVADGQPAVIVTATGVLKRVDATQLDPRQPGPVIGLRDGDRVVAAFCAPDDADVVLVTTDARVLRTPLGKVRPQGRTAGGVAGIRLNDGATVLGAGPAHSGDTMVATLSDGALVKVCPAVEYPQKGRGGGGVAERRMRRTESRLTAVVVTDRAVTGVSSKGAPVAIPEPSGRNDAGAPAARELTGLSVVAR